ncbi:MAG: hypothetical protein LBG11_09095, partial [Bifidobacteriaceae bacterium]|nr:hypothetical protein [Bifidobacteriaceae bacterium]
MTSLYDPWEGLFQDEDWVGDTPPPIAAQPVPQAEPELIAGAPPGRGPTPPARPRGPSVADRLVGIARDGYTLGRTPEGDTYALAAGGHVAYPIRDQRGGSLRRQLAAAYLDLENKAPSNSGMADALATLEGLADR